MWFRTWQPEPLPLWKQVSPRAVEETNAIRRPDLPAHLGQRVAPPSAARQGLSERPPALDVHRTRFVEVDDEHLGADLDDLVGIRAEGEERLDTAAHRQ